METDPRVDLLGLDFARKLVVLAGDHFRPSFCCAMAWNGSWHGMAWHGMDILSF
jgi:hypothetical protein